MVDLRYPLQYVEALNIFDNGFKVGTLKYKKELENKIYKEIKTQEELELLQSIDESRENLQLQSIKIYDAFEGQGFFEEAVSKLETFKKELGFKAIVVIGSGSLIEFYESIGYMKVGYLNSLDKYIMKKYVV